jgi:hypothetical protein
VTYGFPETARAFELAGVPWRALCDYEALIATLDPDPSLARALLEWRDR